MNGKEKNPWIAALLNFLFYGAGYLYVGKRKILGWGLVLVALIMLFETVARPMSHLGDPLGTHSVSMTALAVVLAYDGYKTASME
ncbi:MAG: hypothetical protein ACE5HH_04780 [Candidatus Hydrothermarchaeales archaeon]